MANFDDILKAAVTPNAMLPEANADAAWVPPATTPSAEPSVFGDNYQFGDVPIGNKMDALANASASKRQSVATASATKQQAMSPQQYFENAVGAATGKGYGSASQLEKDLRDLSPLAIRQKYGDQAKELMAGQARGERDLLQADTRGSRDATELWDDFSVGLSQSIIGLLGGVAASGAAMVDDDLGTGAAGLLGDFNKFMDESKSPRLQARKDVVEAKHSLTERDNAADFAEKVKANAQIHLAESGVVGEDRAGTRQSIRDGSAKLTRELSNFGDAIVNASEDSATFGDGIVNALGSYIAVGPVAKGLAAATGGKLGTVAAIGATEASGSYVQATNEVMGKTHDQLMETSAPYRDMIAGGTDPLDAKQAVANQTGLLAAVFTAPGAMAAGRLVHKFEGNVGAFGSLRKLAGNGSREFTEEGTQGAWGQLSQNIAEQAIIDPNKDLGAGVGRQGGEGALYGLGMSAALAVPGITKDAAVGTGRVIAKAFNDRVAGIQQANEKASPVSDEKVAQAFAETQASAPVAEEVLRSTIEASDAAPEVKAAADTYVGDLLTASNYDAVEAPPSLAADFQDVTNRHDAIKRAAEIILGAEEGSPTQLRAGYYLNSLVQDYTAVVNSDKAAQDALPADSQAAQIVRQYKALVESITNTPAVIKAVDTVMAQVEAAEAKKVDVTPESLATPEGQQDVQDVLGAAELAPEKVDLETAEKILKQVNLGNLSVTPRQKAAMDTTVALLRAVQEADKAAVASGQATKVSLNVSSVEGEKGKSVTQHAKGILSAWKAGDRDLAADLLLDLKNFAKGHGNKLAALNAHFAAGDTQAAGLHYNVFAGGKEVKSQKQIAARPHTENGVKLAQQIGAEAKLLADVYNGLVTAFPDLKAKHLAVTPLASGLVGPVADVMARTKPVTTATPAPVVKTEDTTPAVKTAPAPVKESAQTGYAHLSDEDLNAQLNDAFDAVRANPRDRQARAIFDALDDEMTRREDTAVAQNQQEELDGGQTQSNQSEGSNTTIESYVNHSGGAKGADTAWDSIGRRFGVTKHRHYQKDKTPLGNTTITSGQFQEGLIKAKKAAMMLGRNWSNKPYIQGLLSRNWQQVKNADAVFAIAEKLEGDFVSGGTGYAVAMARAEGKPVFVFDQSQGAWFKASEKGWKQSPTPTLTPNFAGIGTRQLSAEGRQAIEDVYAKTKASLANSATMGDVAPVSPKQDARAALEANIESQAEALQAKVEAAFSKENAEFLKLDSNPNMSADQRSRHSELDSLLLTISGVEEAAIGLGNISADSMKKLQSILPKALYDELVSTRAQSRASRNAPEPKVVEPVVQEEPTPAKTEPVAKGIAGVFSHLLGGVKNQFIKAFRIPAQQKSRIISDEGPVSTILAALKDSAAFTAFIGSSPKGKYDANVAEKYEQYLANAPNFLEGLQKRLDAYLNKPYSKKDGRTIGEILATDAEVLTAKGELFEPMRTVDGKALNVAEVVDGKVVYNPELIEGAVLAGLQWLLVSNDYASVVDEKDVAAQTGLKESAITPGLVGLLSQGLSVGEAKRSLAAKIRNYWGVTGDNAGAKGNIEGIPEAIAAELLAYMRESNDIVELNFSVLENGQVVQYNKADGVPQGHRKAIDRLVPQTKDFPKELRAFPDAIEQAVMVTPEETQFIGEDARPPVAKMQLRNPLVENTDQQKQVIENNGETPYTVDTFMGAFYSGLGKDNFLELFGAGKFDADNMNVNHVLSLEGKNQGAAAAFDHMMGTFERIESVGPIGETPIRYPYNTSRVSRLQMLGKFSPQANKQVRDAILSTWSTLDLSDRSGLDYHRFSMGMAQALGIKIHNQMPETSRTKVQAKLDGPLKPAVEFFQNWLLSHQDSHVTNPVLDIPASSVKELVDAFKQADVGKPTAAGLHAVMEYARYLDNKDKSSFRTSLYVEADGKTNGPFNAIVLFATGAFTALQLRVLAKAGMFINRPGMSANKWTAEHDSEDIYTETANKLKEGLTALRATLSKNNPLMLKQMDHMLVLLDLFFGKDLSFNDDGDLVIDIDRGVTKNPLTITIYGAGAPGIAGNVVSTLTGLIYERMSEVALAQANGTASSWAEAMFGKTSVSTEQAEAKLTKFKESIDALTNNKVDNYKGKLTLVRTPIKTEPQTPISYTLTTQQLDNMQSTVLELFVTPLRTAIENTVGSTLMATVTDMRMAVQSQSIVMEFAFKAELQSMLDKKAATDPSWKKGDFLTQGEITEAYKKLEHLAPRITTGTQTFYIGGGEISDIASQFAGGLDGSYRTPGFLFGPSDAGVAGIPYLTIGPGDGQMIQNYSIDPDRASGSLPIFDGIHLPLDQMEKGSIAANKAVADSLQGNPLAAVHKTFSQFMQDGDLSTMSEEQAKALTRALFPDVPRNKTVPVADIIKRMQTLEQSLNTRQQQIEARHRVFAKVPLSMDQMAAIASPYQQEGTVELEGVEFDELIPQLVAMYEEELAAIKGAAPVRTIAPAVIERGTKHETGVYILNSADIANLTTVFPDNQAAVMKEVVSSLAAEEYTVILGTMANVDAYNAATGREGLSEAEKTNGDVRGYTNFQSKTITLFTAATETLSHELLHAGTFSVLSNHYMGVTNRVITGSVNRLEALMGQFLTLGEELTSTNESFNDTYNNTVAVINGYLANGSQAAALNEFMAWTLNNEQLARLAKRTTATKLGRIKDGIVAAIKAMFGIKQDVGKDMFSNLLFNTSILMHSQPSLAQQFANNNLHQSSIYGTSERLSDINEALNKTVGRYLETPVRAGNIDETSALMTGIQNGYRVAESFMAHGFDMTPQESSTFITIVTALSTEAAIDPNAMAGVQQLYAHVMKGLSIESFMADPDANDPNDRAQAAEKFDVLSGKYLVTRDLAGRSSLLPSFLALATTNDEFRAVLAKIALPKTAKDKSGTLDALLENFGNMLMDKLGQRMQGTKKATNVQQAIDLLNAYMAQVINRRDTFISTTASKPGGVVDITNDKVVGAMQWLSKKAMKLAKPSLRAEASRMEKAAGGALAGFAAMIDDDTANAVAEATMTAINKTKMWTWVHTSISDLVGRTANNALIFDMIKIVRATVQRTRQQYRENLPVALAKKFSRELTKNEKASMHYLARADIAALGADALKLLTDPTAAIKGLEADLSKTQHWKLIQAKAKQLAHYMVTDEPGHNLLRNPDAIAHLLNENVKVGAMADTAKLDHLITLYALESLSQEDKDTLVSLAQDEKEGMNFTLAYLQGQRAEEQRKATGNAKFNLYKGYVPFIQNESASMIVADDTEYATLIGKSYVRIGNYYGSSAESEMNKGYYFIPVAARTTFEQGIMQNVHQTAGGVDAVTGFSSAQMAGRITHPAYVKQLTRRMQRQVTGSPLLPVFNEQGEVIAYERSLDPAIMKRTLGEQDLHKAIGQWRGRQVEEGFSQVFNNALMTNLKTMYERDLRANPDNARQYVDVLASKDPVIRDAVRLMNHETKAMAEKLFGKTLMVRRELLYDVMGYRAASLGDAWTGNSRWSPETLKAVRNIATAAFGNDAYKTFMKAEKMIQNVVSDAKVLVVVKSVVVPMANLLSNFLQLAARGVPVAAMTKAVPKKLAEIESYTRSLVRLIEAEAELRASRGDARVERKLKTEIQAINDDHRRMSIWPLIAAGEFSGIADAGMTRAEINLTSGRMQAYMEQAAAKLPGWGSTVGRYALVTKDTALYAALQKSVEYGDFLAKTVLYDHYIGKRGMTKAEALAEITEEYVHYDRLPGRDRGALESFGMLWFYNYKIRSVKVAASMIRNNPVHTLLATLAPMPEFFGSIEMPTEANVISKLVDGSLSYSIGPGQGMHAAMLNPWINLTQ